MNGISTTQPQRDLGKLLTSQLKDSLIEEALAASAQLRKLSANGRNALVNALPALYSGGCCFFCCVHGRWKTFTQLLELVYKNLKTGAVDNSFFVTAYSRFDKPIDVSRYHGRPVFHDYTNDFLVKVVHSTTGKAHFLRANLSYDESKDFIVNSIFDPLGNNPEKFTSHSTTIKCDDGAYEIVGFRTIIGE